MELNVLIKNENPNICGTGSERVEKWFPTRLSGQEETLRYLLAILV